MFSASAARRELLGVRAMTSPKFVKFVFLLNDDFEATDYK